MTHLRYGLKHDTSLVANSLLSPTVKEILKSANISQVARFLWPTVYIVFPSNYGSGSI